MRAIESFLQTTALIAAPTTTAARWMAAVLLASAIGTINLAPQASALESAALQAPLPPYIPWSGTSEALVVSSDDPWITPAERDDFRITPDYAETRRWLERLAAASPLLSLHTFGLSGEGRELFYVRASGAEDGSDNNRRPVVLIQAGIHSHEIDGKDAGLMLLRDIGLRQQSGLVKDVDLVFVPIYNVDGHERTSVFNAAHLRGPENNGTRKTAQQINLNLDYSKADAPETRAMLRLIQALNPVLYIDVHVSDGFDHGYDVTYTYAAWGHYMKSEAIARWLNGPFETGVNTHLRSRGHTPHFYPSALDHNDIGKGLRVSAEWPIWSTGYGDFIHLPTVLVEMHHLKPYRQRVLGAYSLMEAALLTVAEQRERLKTAIAADRRHRPKSLAVRWERDEQPMQTIPFIGVASERYQSAVTGKSELRYLGRTEQWELPVTGQHAVEFVDLPVAWWVPASQTEVIDLLDLHAIKFERMGDERSLELDTIQIKDLTLDRASETRIRMSGAVNHAIAMTDMPAGSIRVPADQPLGLLAAALLEPEAPDSLFSWGFFPEMMEKSGSLDRFLGVALAEQMLREDDSLRQAFNERLASDPDFAADDKARLRWFRDRSGYAEKRYGRYPIAREVP